MAPTRRTSRARDGEPPASDGLFPVASAEDAESQIVEQSKRIEFFISEYTVELLTEKMRNGDFVIPSYQREFTWEHARQSRFIESVVMGLPIPFLFFWEMPDGRLEIVDGGQRLRTLEEFISGELRLDDLGQLTQMSGFTFTDLPESRQRKIKNRSIRGIILNEHADDAARFDMFERINTGSKIANTAEVRRGALSGPFQGLVAELATDERFIELAPMSTKQQNERGREELVTRFFAYGDGLEGYRDRPADFMFDYSRKMNTQFTDDPELADSYRQRFYDTMRFVRRTFPYGFAKGPSGRATPRARFESIAIGSAEALRQRPDLAEVDPKAINVAEWLTSKEFVEITGADGANAKSRLMGRINYVKGKLVAR